MADDFPILASLRLEQTGETQYQGPSVPSDTRPVVFGGQLLGQMIVAAATAQPGKTVRSIHAIFARAGTTKLPVGLDVDVMHSGRSLASVTVTARQEDRLISRGMLLLDAGEPDLIRHGATMPDIGSPDSACPQDWADEGSEVRVVDGVDLAAAEVTGPPELSAWTRFTAAPDDIAVNQALLSWYTDPFLIGASMRPHDGIGQGMAHAAISTGVLTHTLSFHEPVRAADWHLLAQRGTYAGGGRAYGRGEVFTEDGRHVASFVQDNMIRSFRDTQTTRGSATMTM